MTYQTLITFGERVHAERIRQGFTPRGLARRVNISTEEELQIERGKKDVSIVYAKVFAAALHVRLSDLLE